LRINKYLALVGLGSRRKVEELVVKGEIKVNGKIVTSLSYDIKDGDNVEHKGKKLNVNKHYEYYMLNKPKGYITALSDDRDRKTIMNLVSNIETRVFPVGRLDYQTEGLLFLTNDGDLANRIMKPNYKVEKTYICVIEGEIQESELATLRNGVVIDGKKLNKCKVSVKEFKDNKSKLKITINQGINRQIRKMMDVVNKNVVSLKRVAIGEIRLGGLSRGEYRKLKDKEITYLYALCGMR